MTCTKDCKTCRYGKEIKVKITCAANSESGITCNGQCENCLYNVHLLRFVCYKNHNDC